MNRTNKIKLLNNSCVFKINYILAKTTTDSFMSYSEFISTLKNECSFWKNIDTQNKIENGFSIILINFLQTIEELPDYLSNDINESTNLSHYIKTFISNKSISSTSPSSNEFIISLAILNKDYKNIKEVKNTYIKFYNTNKNVFTNLIEIFHNPSNLWNYMRENEVGTISAIQYIGIMTKSMKLSSDKKIIYDDLNNLNEQIKSTNTNIESQRKYLQSFNEEYKGELETWKTSKEGWFKEWDLEKAEWFSKKEREILNLEQTYEEKLKLAKPVEYWKEEAEKRKKSFRIWMFITAFLSIAIILISSQLIKEFYDIAMKDSISKSFVPFSFIMVALVTFIIYLLRMAIKIMMSAKHLQTEYEQKATFTYFYLILLKENEVSARLEKEDRSYIIQTLFSQVDTGLIKADSGNDVEKLLMGLLSKRS